MGIRKFVHVDDAEKVIEIADTEFAQIHADAILSFTDEDGRKLFKEEVVETKKK
jgi:glutamate/tyrosine decarboxylase-like PLP-dependent enzyme